MTAALRQIAQEERRRRATAWQREIARAPRDKAAALHARAQGDDDIWASIVEATRIGFRYCDCDAAWRSICATVEAAIARHDGGQLPRAKVMGLLALRNWLYTSAPREAPAEAKAA